MGHVDKVIERLARGEARDRVHEKLTVWRRNVIVYVIGIVVGLLILSLFVPTSGERKTPSQPEAKEAA